MDGEEASTAETPRAADIFEAPNDGVRLVTWPEVQRLAEGLADIGDQVAAEMTRIQVSERPRTNRRRVKAPSKALSRPKHRRHVGHGIRSLLAG